MKFLEVMFGTFLGAIAAWLLVILVGWIVGLI